MYICICKRVWAFGAGKALIAATAPPKVRGNVFYIWVQEVEALVWPSIVIS